MEQKGHSLKMQQASTILNTVFGYPAFRGQQEAIISHINQGGNALVLMPTGGGKSMCYQIPALVRQGVAIVVSPLVALMQDQVSALQALGVKAACLHAATPLELARDIVTQARSGTLQLLYVAPERLLAPRFMAFLNTLSISLFAIDEAHCVSHWGHDFRPEYQQLGVLADQFPAVPRIALTATADEQTRLDIAHYLKLNDAKLFLSSFDRPNIFYHVVEKNNAKKQLLAFIRSEFPSSCGVVYCLSRRRTEETALWLRSHGIRALPYHAGLSFAVREDHQRQFLHDEAVVMVATVAFGMGIDKPDVRFVAHIDLPKSLENFYQESGRAGRDGLPATSWLCYGLNDLVQLGQMITQSEMSALQKQIELGKLDEMLAFCETAGCRRQQILTYFGEDSQACGDCDNCRYPPPTYEATVVVQKVLSCIYRAKQRCSAGQIIDILLGKSNEANQAVGYTHLSTFGIGKELNAKAWRSIIRQLVARKIIQVDMARGQSLILTDAARPLLKGEEVIYLRPLRDEQQSARQVLSGERWLRTEREERIWQAIRRWRQTQAKEHNVPAYVILSDRSLRDLVERKPTHLHALAQVYGLGEMKIARYGKALLQLIQDADLHTVS